MTAPAAAPLATVKLARVKYAGNWDPEPLAWTRYANWLQRKTGTRIDARETAAADLKTPGPAEFPLAHLTGTAKYPFTAADAAAVRAYVRAGGLLLVDACGGGGNAGVTAGAATGGTPAGRSFDASVEALLAAAFPEEALQTMQANHPMLQKGLPGTEDVTLRRLRPDTAARLGRSAGAMQVLSSGKGHVLYTQLDLTSGLLGAHTVGILGYEPDYAQAMMKNLVFWALDGQADR